jgi:transketolase
MADKEPAYVRTGRNAVADVYEEGNVPFEMDKATVIREGDDLAIIACGEMVLAAKEAGEKLAAEGINATVIDMYCIKPLDKEAVLKAAKTGKVITVEEHVAIGGMGSMVAQVIAANEPCKVVNLTLPDSPVITGTSKEVFKYYGLDVDGIVKAAKELL